MGQRGRSVAGSRVPEARRSRLPLYLHALSRLPAEVDTVASADLAAMTGVTAAVLRKDLAALRINGRRGVGYDRTVLSERLQEALGSTAPTPVVVAGRESLLALLSACPAFAEGSLQVVDSVLVQEEGGDDSPAQEDLARTLQRWSNATVVAAVPKDRVDALVERLVLAGAQSIYSLAPVSVPVPADVVVRTLDLSAELALTSVIDTADADSAEPGPAGERGAA